LNKTMIHFHLLISPHERKTQGKYYRRVLLLIIIQNNNKSDIRIYLPPIMLVSIRPQLKRALDKIPVSLIIHGFRYRVVAVDDVVVALLDYRNLRLELAVDRGKIVRVQHAHV